jgi:maltose/moltooligosaccharide transporter
MKVPELPLTPAEEAQMRLKPRGLAATLGEIKDAFVEMPQAMRQLWWMKLFQWYGMICYWQYVVHALARSLFDTADSSSAGFREAALVNGQIGGFYNFIAFAAAIGMVPFTRRFGAAKVHATCLVAGGLGMLALPGMHDRWWIFLPMVGVGLAWGSIMGNPYVMLARSIPPERTGVYMGIFNMFIVIPMLIQSFTLPLFYKSWLGGDPRQVVMLGGALLICAAVATLFVKVPGRTPESAPAPPPPTPPMR